MESMAGYGSLLIRFLHYLTRKHRHCIGSTTRHYSTHSPSMDNSLPCASVALLCSSPSQFSRTSLCRWSHPYSSANTHQIAKEGWNYHTRLPQRCRTELPNRRCGRYNIQQILTWSSSLHFRTWETRSRHIYYPDHSSCGWIHPVLCACVIRRSGQCKEYLQISSNERLCRPAAHVRHSGRGYIHTNCAEHVKAEIMVSDRVCSLGVDGCRTTNQKTEVWIDRSKTKRSIRTVKRLKKNILGWHTLLDCMLW